jgi:hypothetical protein
MSSGTYLPYIYVGHFQASGSAVNVDLSDCPDGSPDACIAWNETKFATDATNVVFFWTRGYSDGDASIIKNDTTDGMMGVAETTNGYTDTESVSYASNAVTATKRLTFGTAVAGANDDEIHFIIIYANKFSDLGDQA